MLQKYDPFVSIFLLGAALWGPKVPHYVILVPHKGPDAKAI